MNTDDALQHFGMYRTPFGLKAAHVPFYSGPQHGDALGFLDRALHSNDLIVALTGERGIGKSLTLDFAVRQKIPGALVATIDTLPHEQEEFLQTLLVAFGFESVRASIEEMRGLLSVFLGHQRQKGVVTVIVAENVSVMPADIIEELNWLSLLESVRLGRLKLVLMGGEQLESQLSAPRMHALRQMIRWQHRLEPLGVAETRDYLEFRVEAAGSKRSGGVFAADAVARIHAYTGGVPGRIDPIAERALEAASEAGAATVQGAHVQPLGIAEGDERPRRRVASLDIMLGIEPKARIRLNTARLLIGRHPWNDVQLDHDSVSRFHAMLVREGGYWTVVDLNSTNGIRVNEQSVRQRRLRHGDVVQVGSFQLALNDGAGPEHALPQVTDCADTTIQRG